MKIMEMRFPEGKEKAFTASYDDGVIQDLRLVEIMNHNGIKCTFNLNSGYVMPATDNKFNFEKISQDRFNDVYRGHEIASHSLTHMRLTNTHLAVVTSEILEDRKNLENITGEFITGFAYPFGEYDENVITSLKSCGMDYARTVNSTMSFSIPDNFYTWNPTCHHNYTGIGDLIERFCNESSPYGVPELFYLWGHSYEFDLDNNWSDMEKHLEIIGRQSDKIWYATNYEIYSYIKAYQSLKISINKKMLLNNTMIDLWLNIDGIEYFIGKGETLLL